MAEHYLKTLAPYWDAIYRGEKTFEVRKNDRLFQCGDIVILSRLPDGYPDQQRYQTPYFQHHENIRKKVGWILHGGQFGIAPDYCVFALEDAPPEMSFEDLEIET
jgi:hypothetical protein